MIRKFLFFFLAMGLTCAAMTKVGHAATVITGGDPGEGLNFSGTYLYAVDIAGPGGTVQGLTFTPSSTTVGSPVAGVTLGGVGDAGIFGTTPGVARNYGGSGNDTGLNAIMNGLNVACCGNVGNYMTLDYATTPGTTYNLMLLLDSSGFNPRAMDITVNGVTVESNLAIAAPAPLSATPASQLVSYTYTATSGTTNVVLGGSDLLPTTIGGDNNPVLNAFAVQQLGTVGYWQAQDGIGGSAVTTMASTVNNASLQGSVAGGAPTFSSSVPGPAISDGLGGPIVNSNNSASLSVVSGDRIQIPQSGLTEASSMTTEFFYKTTQAGAYAGAVVLPSTVTGPSNIAWGLGTDGVGNATFSRVDVVGVGGVNSTLNGGPAINDNQWHHLALTFDGNTNSQRLYLDYNLVSLSGLPNGLAYDGVNGLRFGSSGTDFQNTVGLIDEIRYSNFALSPSQFLHLVLEPTTLGLLGSGLVGLLAIRRRK